MNKRPIANADDTIRSIVERINRKDGPRGSLPVEHVLALGDLALSVRTATDQITREAQLATGKE